jgi:hypothetical protein
VHTTLWGIPTQISQENTLSNKIDHGWNNIHWLRVGEDKRQQFFQVKRLLKRDHLPEDPSQEKQKASQLGFTFGEQMSLIF